VLYQHAAPATIIFNVNSRIHSEAETSLETFNQLITRYFRKLLMLRAKNKTLPS